MQKVDGIYKGLVIQNNDPEKRGRVKVFVPFISTTIHTQWNELATDKKFKFPDKSSVLSPVWEKLKESLPWAEQCAPIFGESGSGRYNAVTETGSISDSALDFGRYDNTNKIFGGALSFVQSAEDSDKFGGKSGIIHEKNPKNDSFNTTENNVNRVNPYSYEFKPKTYSNSAKGLFSIPSVGSHVWVSFLDGNHLHPIYFGVSFGADDFSSIFSSIEDYPANFENYSSSDGQVNDKESQIYRNKLVLNQRGGVMEIVNTSHSERMSFTHFSGSFLEFNNKTTSAFNSNNFQSLTLKDEFTTVNGHKSLHVGMEFDEVVKGDRYKKVGNLDAAPISQWKSLMSEVNDYRLLFDTQRTTGATGSQYKVKSSLQTQNGALVNVMLSKLFPTQTISTSHSLTGSASNDPSAVSGSGSASNNVSVSSSVSNSTSFGGSFSVEPKKAQTPAKIQTITQSLLEQEILMGNGGSEFNFITKHKVENIGMVMNDFGAIRVDPIGKVGRCGVAITSSGDCVYDNIVATPLVERVHVDALPSGNYTLNVANKFETLVGAGGISSKTFGNYDISGAQVSMFAQSLTIASRFETIVDGGKKMEIMADYLVLRTRNREQVCVDGSIGVSHNVIIGGGLHVEGETIVQHITGPAEVHETESTAMNSGTFTLTGCTVSGTNPNVTISGTLSVFPAHSHRFYSLPMTLKTSSTGVRNVAKNLIVQANDPLVQPVSNRSMAGVAVNNATTPSHVPTG